MTAPDTTVPPGARAPTAVDATGLWADLRAALRGTNADYTRIPLKRAVLLLAVPMMLELVTTRASLTGHSRGCPGGIPSPAAPL